MNTDDVYNSSFYVCCDSDAHEEEYDMKNTVFMGLSIECANQCGAWIHDDKLKHKYLVEYKKVGAAKFVWLCSGCDDEQHGVKRATFDESSDAVEEQETTPHKKRKTNTNTTPQHKLEKSPEIEILQVEGQTEESKQEEGIDDIEGYNFRPRRRKKYVGINNDDNVLNEELGINNDDNVLNEELGINLPAKTRHRYDFFNPRHSDSIGPKMAVIPLNGTIKYGIPNGTIKYGIPNGTIKYG
eukprot:129307_1